MKAVDYGYNNLYNGQYKLNNNNFNVKLKESNIDSISNTPGFDISLKDNLKLLYSNFSQGFLKKTKIFWNKLNQDYNLEVKYNNLKEKATEFLINNIDNNVNKINKRSNKLTTGLNNLWEKLKNNLIKTTTIDIERLKSRVKVVETIKTRDLGYIQDNINKLTKQNITNKDIEATENNTNVNQNINQATNLTNQKETKKDIQNNIKDSLFERAKLNEEPRGIVRDKIIESKSYLARYHNCQQAEKSTFRELAIASFLEAFKLQTNKIQEDIKITDFYSHFEMAKTNSTRVPHNREIVNFGGFNGNLEININNIEKYLKTLVGDNANNIEKFNLDIKHPLDEVYHEYQRGPFCQTVCLNNYLGYNFFHPSLGLLLTSKDLNVMDINYSAPTITINNKEEVHNKLIKLLIQSAKKWDFDIELLKPIINKLDIGTITFKDPNKIVGDYSRNLNELKTKIRENNLQDLFLNLGAPGTLHIISMKKSKNNEGRWILLDGNHEPFEVNFDEFINYLKESAPYATIHYSKKNVNDNIDEQINKSSMPDIITKNMNSQIAKNYEENNIYINALNYIDKKIIQNIDDKEVISRMLNKEGSIINSEILPQTFVSSIKSFISMTNSFGENIKGNISNTNNSIKDIESYLTDKKEEFLKENINYDQNIIRNININIKELTNLRKFLGNLSNIENLTPQKLVSSISSIFPNDIHRNLSNILNEHFNKEYINYKSNNWESLEKEINSKEYSEIFDSFTFKKLNEIRENLDIDHLKKTNQRDVLLNLTAANKIDIRKSQKLIEGFIKNIKTSANKIDGINKNIDVEGKINELLENIKQHKNDHNFKKSISLFSIKSNMILSMFDNKEVLDGFFNKKILHPNVKIGNNILYLNPNEKIKIVIDTIKYCIISQLLTDIRNKQINNLYSSSTKFEDHLLKLTNADRQLLAKFISIANNHHEKNSLYIQPFDYSIYNK